MEVEVLEEDEEEKHLILLFLVSMPEPTSCSGRAGTEELVAQEQCL